MIEWTAYGMVLARPSALIQIRFAENKFRLPNVILTRMDPVEKRATL